MEIPSLGALGNSDVSCSFVPSICKQRSWAQGGNLCSGAQWLSGPTLEDVSPHQGGAAPAEKPFQRKYILSEKCNSVLDGAWPFGNQQPLPGAAQQPDEPHCPVHEQNGGGYTLALLLGLHWLYSA